VQYFKDKKREAWQALKGTERSRQINRARQARRKDRLRAGGDQCRACSARRAPGRTACARHLAYFKAFQLVKERTCWLEVLAHFGHRCACCGESEPKFLSIDHVNNDGHKQRKTRRAGGYAALIRRVKREGWPSDLQLLCFNCNLGKARNGGICPHRPVAEAVA
jgi:hypothetical protein